MVVRRLGFGVGGGFWFRDMIGQGWRGLKWVLDLLVGVVVGKGSLGRGEVRREAQGIFSSLVYYSSSFSIQF